MVKKKSYVSSASHPLFQHNMEQDLLCRVPSSVDGELDFIPDLRRIGLLGSHWLVSRKCNTNIFNLANVWKKTVFNKIDEEISEEGGVVPMIPDLVENHDALTYDSIDDLEVNDNIQQMEL